MVNIIHLNVHCDDNRRVTALEIKLKSIPEEVENENSQHLVARVSAAFFATTLLADAGKSLRTTLNPKRRNVVNLHVVFRENNLSFDDVTKFINAFQCELDKAPF